MKNKDRVPAPGATGRAHAEQKAEVKFLITLSMQSVVLQRQKSFSHRPGATAPPSGHTLQYNKMKKIYIKREQSGTVQFVTHIMHHRVLHAPLSRSARAK